MDSRINSKNINQYANRACQELNKLGTDKFMKAPELANALGLNVNQVKGLCTYIKDCSQFVDYEKYINWYVISSKEGYALLKNQSIENIAKCYKKLFLSVQAEKKRISPILRFLNEKGIDIDTIELNENDFSESEKERMLAFSEEYNDFQTEDF